MLSIKFPQQLAAVLVLPFMFLTAQAQLSGQDTGYIKRLPGMHWIDDLHYSYYSAGLRQNVSVNAATGESVPANTFYPVKKREVGKNENTTWSPDSLYIAYTRDNDLYIYDTAGKKEWRVTNDGSDAVYNGRSSWVYNEEILGRATNYRAFWWSPDSRHLAFMHFNDTNVPVYDHFNDEGVHGKHTPIHYPQPGDPNPAVKMGIAGIQEHAVTWASYNEQTDQYFGTPYWKPDGSALWMQWMNRRQDTLKIDEVNLQSGALKNIYTESQSTWIDLDLENRITFVPGRKQFILMSDQSGWQHLYLYDYNGKLVKQLTSGQWTVTEINVINKQKGEVFFTARKENSARFDLYKVRLEGGEVRRLTFGPYNHRVQVSPGGSYFITTYSNYATPARMALLNSEGKLVKELGDSKGVAYEHYQPLVRKSAIIRVQTADGFDLPVRITWPAKLDTTRKYPLLAHIYGGPNFTFVTDGFSGGFSIQDDTSSNSIQVLMDHRGSGHFGKAGQNWLFHQLGKWEIADYTTVIRYLEKTYPFIDTTHIGISGFSYGGYITCMALTKAADVFNYGLAGGSVTDWRLYDSPYTERYMGKPDENEAGYKNSSVMTYVKNYKGMLKLAQGTMDDNVHMQNTMQLAGALQNAGKHFELMLYPGGAHGWLNLHEKYAHYMAEDQRFINTYLLNKKVP